MLLRTGSILSLQQSVNTPSMEPDGLPVGVWESLQVDGSAVGLDLSEVPATVQSGQPEPEDFAKRKSALQVGVFQKHHQRIACGEENFFVIGEKDELFHDAVSSYDYLALRLSKDLRLPVLNETGITGSYDYYLPPDDPDNQDVATTVLRVVDRLGLKIKRGRGPIKTLVIDHIQGPSEN